MTAAIMRKDLVALWVTPVPYVVGALLQAVLGVLMVNQLEVRSQAVLQPLFPIAGFLLLLVVPVLAMRSLADENRSGSIDLLLVSRVPAWRIALGKFLATWLTALAVTAPAGVYVALVAAWGDPDPGPAATGFVGLALLCGFVAGLGMLASSVTVSQPIAAMSTLAAALILWFAHRGSETITTGDVLAAVSLSERMRSFASGGLDSGDIAFFLVATALCIAVTAVVVDARRLR